MIRSLRTLAVIGCLFWPAFAHTQGAPVQWNYDFGGPGGQARATYPGAVKMSGIGGIATQCVIFSDSQGDLTSGPCSSGNGITQLTGDVTAGPGSGSVPATLAASGVTAGTYNFATVTVDAKGRVTSASSGSVAQQYAQFANVQTSGNKSNGAAYEAINSTYANMILNTSVVNTITGASLASNQVTLPAGVYSAEFIVPFNDIAATANNIVCTLFNVTGSAILGIAPAVTQTSTSTPNSNANIVFSLAGSTAVSIQCRSTNTSNVGTPMSIAGQNEFYENLTLVKIG